MLHHNCQFMRFLVLQLHDAVYNHTLRSALPIAQEKLQRRRKRAYKPTAADADDKLQQIEQADISIAAKKVMML
jgi:hypothetical protein